MGRQWCGACYAVRQSASKTVTQPAMIKNLYVQCFFVFLSVALSISALDTMGNDYDCTNRNSYSFSLDWDMAPMPMLTGHAGITMEPRDTTGCESDSIWFMIADTNATSYTWQVNDGTGWADASGPLYQGLDSATLIIASINLSIDSNLYRCIAEGTTSNDTSMHALLTVNPEINVTLSKQICTGDSIILGGSYRLVSGTYVDTLSAALTGCDSIVSTELAVQDSIVYDSAMTVCNGDSIMIHGVYQSAAGSYDQVLTAAFGCDSIVRVDLTLINPVTGNDTTDLCQGDSVMIGGMYRMTDGTYQDTTSSVVTGCDSIVFVVLETFADTTVNETAYVCPGDSIFVGGGWQTTPGAYSDTLLSAGACNYVRVTTLTAASLPTVTVSPTSAMICEGEPTQITGTWSDSSQWYRNGNPIVAATSSSITVYTSGIYNLVNTNALGCSDSAATGATITTMWCTGIEEFNVLSDVLIWPNPSSGEFKVELPENAGKWARIEVLNITGKSVTHRDVMLENESRIVPISVNGVPNGIYMVAVKMAQKTATKRLIIEQ